ncbi:HWE histidine kinase domain-containing protein [Altererythrobacter arenosus]|uniref:histidine kinase n=1 Tax=Altererythrobacter arenosus TaxID=3032592 RepID=A0ABY8FVU3_9SPHN|nr:HWE histidine kinase domain-containing protein [Altererythrobacter sp. CAU 1644]WFL77521.1 HWE histidine kinase domain-containing protein [Altererythrobacter sp. CAU 1644]
MEFLSYFEQYMPHGMCLLWQPWLLILWAGSDLLIFLSYMAIPFALFQVLKQRQELQHRGLIALFASFILLCGVTHLFSIVTLWFPIYPISGVFKLATGVVSAITAIVLFRLVPVLVTIPTPSELQKANADLRAEVAAHERTLEELRKARDELEMRVEQRTEELRQVNAKLAVIARETAHRSRNLLSVVSSLARQTARSTPDIEQFVTVFQGRINALAMATLTVIEGANESSAGLERIIKRQIEALFPSADRQVVIEGERVMVGAEAAQQISLAVYELATNAQKHGAHDKETAYVHIDWSVSNPGTDQPELVFEWREKLSDGAASFQPGEKSGGFGSNLLLKIVPAMLKGSASRHVENGVMVYQLLVPLASVTDADGTHGDVSEAARIIDRNFGIA